MPVFFACSKHFCYDELKIKQLCANKGIGVNYFPMINENWMVFKIHSGILQPKLRGIFYQLIGRNHLL